MARRYVKIMPMFEKELKNKIEDYRRRTKDNELDVMTSARCGCLSCGHSFSARDIHYWVEDGSVLSARCPQCGLPYVIADSTGLPVDKKTMER